MSIVPEHRPFVEIGEALEFGEKFGLKPPFLLGLRGFVYPGQNHRGIYDDAIVIVDPITFETFNANTDPSKFGRGLATLKAPQVAWYKIGTHNITKEKNRQYQALVQAQEVTVIRDGIKGEDRGWFGINIHRGGNNTPGSEGCQTIPPTQWVPFMMAVTETFRMRGIGTIPYLLVEV